MLPRYFDERPTAGAPTAKGFPPRSQSSAPPKYVTLARLQEQTAIPSAMHNGGRCLTGELKKLSSLEDYTEQDEEASGDSREDDSSGNETETETVHGMPIAVTPMPAYVSMIENPLRASEDDEDEDDEDDEEEDVKKDVVRLGPSQDPSLKTVKGIEKGPDKRNIESESFTHYVPHHVFGKESIHT